MRPYLDLAQVDTDELAAARADRDRHREPGTGTGIRHITPRVTQGARFMVDVDTSTVRLDCPRCRGPVFATRDSSGEQVDCVTCDARLVTRTDLEGAVSLLELEVPDAR